MPTMVSRSRGRRAINEINMVPFIDVMLVLLIIFMVTAPLIAPSVIDLPRVGKAAQAPSVVIQVLVGSDDSLRLKLGNGEDQPVKANALAAEVKKLQPGAAPLPVVIAADKAVRYETVVKVMDTLQRAGVQRLGLSVQLQPSAPAPAAIVQTPGANAAPAKP
jgi:biopolymer transport protein TolR